MKASSSFVVPCALGFIVGAITPLVTGCSSASGTAGEPSGDKDGGQTQPDGSRGDAGHAPADGGHAPVDGGHAPVDGGHAPVDGGHAPGDAENEGSTSPEAGDATALDGGLPGDGGSEGEASTKPDAAPACSPADVFVAPWFQIVGGGGTRDTASGDLNNDGLTDVVTLGGGGPGNPFTVNLNKGGSAFATAVPYHGPDPSGEGIAVGDIDGDGFADIVYSGIDSESNSGVAVALNKKDGTFGTPVLYATAGLIPESLSVYDLNNDGKLDVVMSAQVEETAGEGFYVMLNGGGGKLNAPITEPSGVNPADLGHPFSIVDLNGDGTLDVAFFNDSGACVAFGNGDGTFQNQTCTTGTGDAVSINAIGVGDFNGDHQPDLVLFNFGTAANSADLFLNSGTGTFPSYTAVPGGEGGTLDGVVLDWNNDGKLDIVRYGTDARLVISLGHGDGTFDPNTLEAAFSDGDANGGSILPGDYLGNGLVGLATATSNPAGFEILAESCRTTIPAPASVLPPTDVPASTCAPAHVALSTVSQTTTISTYQGAAAADVDGDGKVDLLQLGGSSDSAAFSYQLSNGDGTFAAPVDVAGSPNGTIFAVGDFNGDGFVDVVYPSLDSESVGQVAIALNDGHGSFKNPVYSNLYSSSGGAEPSVIGVGDVNNDGFLDVVVDEILELGRGDGTFAGYGVPIPFFGAGAGAIPIPYRLVDLNGDQQLDAVFIQGANGGTTGGFCVALNIGNANFGPVDCSLAISSDDPTGVAVGDLNHDGKVDVVVTYNGTTGGLNTFLGNGDGTFQTAKVSDLADVNSNNVELRDFNNDGKLDLLVWYTIENEFVLTLGKGDGTFAANGQTFGAGTYGDYRTQIAVGDFRADGLLGFAVVNSDRPGFDVVTASCTP